MDAVIPPKKDFFTSFFLRGSRISYPPAISNLQNVTQLYEYNKFPFRVYRLF